MRIHGLSRVALVWMLLLAAVLSQHSLASAADSYDSLVAAIQAANSGNGDGTITLSGDIVLTAALPPITGSLTIDGGGRSISGDGKYRIFDVNGGSLAITNLTLTEGRAPDDEDGGALRMRAGAEVSVQQVTFSNNTAYQGGAIAANGAGVQLEVKQSSFIGNNSEAYAAAIFSYGSLVDITSSSFQSNTARGDGGAIAAHEEARMSISNSTFASNSANVGGALEVFASAVTVMHVTMMNNTATPAGGGAIHRTAGEVSLYNSIVGGAPGGKACGNGLTEARGNLSQDGTCSLMETRVDPLVGELTGAPAWYPLLDGSPALDAADAEFCLATDQVGTARPHGGGCDIGAIESTTARLAPTPIVPPPPCLLANQIIAANTDAPSGGCPAGSGADTITLLADVTLLEGLPTVTSEIIIEGNGYTISGGRNRIFDIERGNLTLRNMTLTGARATYGAAIRLRGSARAAIDQVTFTMNSADGGAAIASLSADASATVSRSSFARNRSNDYGGAINVTRGSVTISKSSFVGNQAGFFGGALHTEYGSIVVSDSSFIDNSANGGGVLSALFGKATMTHVTMLNNLATRSNGNAIDNTASAIYLRNSIVGGAGGEADDCSGGLTQAIGNLSEDGTCITTGHFGDPMLGDSTGYPAWRPPLDGSPAIDAADPTFCSETDQIGTPRPQGGGCDIGAIESTTARPPEPDTAVPVCGLYDQIIAANTDRPSGACPAGKGADTISLSEDITLTRPLPLIISGLRIEGNGHAISGDGRFRIFVVKGAWLQVVDITLTEGRNARGNGGAIEMLDYASVAIRNSKFIENSAKNGGAITMFGRDSKLTVIDSSFIENKAFDDTYNIGGSGGAIDMRTGQLNITGSSFVGNQAGHGGAISTGGSGEVYIANSTFTGNNATSWGGVLAAGWPPTTLTHVTMLNNRGRENHQYGAGHAIWIHRQNTGFYMRNSIIAGDMPDENCVGKIGQSIGNLANDSSCLASTSGDALLGQLNGAPAWHAPQAGSPAIDAADARYCLATDQTGRSRPQGGGCDIGAIETVPVRASLSDCRVTTTHVLNFRDGPGGGRIGAVPENATMTAMARTPGWYQVEYRGVVGWISADYVVTQGDCG